MTAAEASAARTARVEVIRPRRMGILAGLREFVRYRWMIRYFGLRMVRARYARTVLGWVWLPLRPTVDVGARVLLFGGLLGVSSGDRPYFVFFIVGMAAWVYFERCAYWAARSLDTGKKVLRSLYFPRLTVVASAAVPAAVEFLLLMTIGLIGILYYLVVHGTFYLEFGVGTLLSVFGLGCLTLFGIGIGLWTAPAAAQARDVRFVLRYVLGFWYFFTPVIYPISEIPEKYQVIAEINPLTAPVEWVKLGLLSTNGPTARSQWVTLCTLAVLLVGGLWFFFRTEARATERL